MKNKLTKFGIGAVATIAIIGGAIFASAQNTPAATQAAPEAVNTQQIDSPVYNGNGFGMMNKDSNGDWSMRDLKGNSDVRDFSQLKSFLPAIALGFLGAGIVLSIIALLFLAFWIWMLVHAIKSDIEYKPVWILVLGLMGILGAIIYYFAVKREYDSWVEGDCDCEDCSCEIVEEKCGTCGNEVCVCEIK